MDFLAVGLGDDARTRPPKRRTAKHLRRSKFVAALAVAALVGVGSYTVTYHALVIIYRPSALAPAPAPHTPVATAIAAPPLVPSDA